jgi:hypothetical protein
MLIIYEFIENNNYFLLNINQLTINMTITETLKCVSN